MRKWLANDIRELPAAWILITITTIGVLYTVGTETNLPTIAVILFWNWMIRRTALVMIGRKEPFQSTMRRR